MSAVLVTKGISKTYGNEKVKVRALRSCSMAIEKGEFVAIVGKSGSGKSTLLRILGTLEPPDEGQVFLEGKEISGLSDKKLSRLRRRRIDLDGRKENKNYIKELMNTLGIYQCRDKFPSEMSGGEQQRVAIARGMCVSPAIILADEPTGNLDAENAEEVAMLMSKASRLYQQTIIMVTHDGQMADYADRILYIRDGRVRERTEE